MTMKPATKDDLLKIYNYWEEHPDYPHAQWVYEVDENDTREGYWDWVGKQIEQDCLDD